jgi:maleylacetoacetate isomerase
MHPVNNLRVLKFLTGTLGLTEEQKMQWYRHWIQVGFEAVERQLSRHAGQFCFGDQVTLADLCLVPQVFNAQRFDCPLDAFPTVMRIHQHCMSLPAFQAAAPQACPDAQA